MAKARSTCTADPKVVKKTILKHCKRPTFLKYSENMAEKPDVKGLLMHKDFLGQHITPKCWNLLFVWLS